MGAARSLHNLSDRHVLIDRDDEIYQAYADAALTPSGRLICVWREAAGHARGSWARLVMRQSADLGRTWSDRRVLADESVCQWAMPRINVLSDGRVVVNAAGFADENSNFLFWSHDEGRTWSAPQMLRVRGIQGRRLVELADGTLLLPLAEIDVPRKRAWRQRTRVTLWASEDGGRSWTFRAVIAESPVLAHDEAPVAKLPDGTLFSYMRENSILHYPSFATYSHDDGRTWTEPVASPMYAVQPNATVLRDGRLLLTYENVGGTLGIYAWCGDGHEATGFEPSASDGNDGCATLTGEGLRIATTGDPRETPPIYLLAPAEDDTSEIVFEARLKCLGNATGDACAINVLEAGEVRFFPDHVAFVQEPLDYTAKQSKFTGKVTTVASFELDATRFHTYRIVRGGDRTLTIAVDGVERLQTDSLLRTRPTGRGPAGHDVNCFGASFISPGACGARSPVMPRDTRGESVWQAVSLRVTNPTLPDHNWCWSADNGELPNQYERDHMLEIARDPHGDCGEPGAVELLDGRIFVAYHTAKDSPEPPGFPVDRPLPYIMGAFIHPEDLP